MDFTADSILEKMKNELKNDTSKIEGSFSMDNLQAVSEELARYYTQLITPLKEDIAERKDDVYTSGNERHYVIWAKEVTDEAENKVVGNARAVGIRDGTGLVQVAIISPTADTPDAKTIQLVTEYFETKRPVGAKPIVTAAQGISVLINCVLELKDGYDINVIKTTSTTKIQEYFTEIAFLKKATSLNYFRIGTIINAIEGVSEIIDYTINGARDSIPADYDEFFKLEGLVLNGS